MAKRVVDPTTFIAAGAAIDWSSSPGTHNPQRARNNAKLRGLDTTSVIELRWAFDAALGYPITPFVVWTRPHVAPNIKLKFSRLGANYLLSEAQDCVYVDIASGPGGLALASSGVVFASAVVAIASVSAGPTMVRIAGPGIRSVVFPSGTVVNAFLAFKNVAEDAAWKPLEIVGLPGDGRAAHKTDLTAPQGMVGSLTHPTDAALDRFKRGAPLCGWPDTLPSGAVLPPWALADPVAMVKLFQNEMLKDFIDMVDTSAFSVDQQTKQYARTLLTPNGRFAEAQFNPLRLFLYGAASDPLSGLIFGMGTAYPLEGRAAALLAVASQRMGTVGAGDDFMITGTFLSVTGMKVERAAFVFAPGQMLPPPTPAAMAATTSGTLSPEKLDDPYRPVISVTWDAPTPLLSFFVGSHAFARRATQPNTAPAMLLDPRPMDTALQPRGASRNVDHPERRAMTDDSWPISSTLSPNQLQYSVASQNVFGLWSAWNETPIAVYEPDAGPVTVTGARLDTSAVPFPCPATVRADLTWNWSSRSPETIVLVGRRYPQASPSDLPSNNTPPNMNAFNASSGGILATITFNPNGSIQSVVGGAGLSATVEHLTIDGQQISPVPITERGARRYRITVVGSTLDFNAAGRWGVALWARGKEHRAPKRLGNWNSQPAVASAADPRPPAMTKTYDQVILASMRDSQGLHRANLEWDAAPGAVAYQVYTSSESTFRSFFGLLEPLQSATLQQRVTELRNAFESNPERRPFTRVGTQPITGTSTSVTLPRGTKELHLYLVLGVSAGNVESEWPKLGDAQLRNRFVVFAAPRTVAPGAPQLEVGQDLDQSTSPPTYRAKVRIKSAAGSQVSKVELFRVRVPQAAVQVETMGPPAYSIAGSISGFSVTPTPPGNPLDPTQVGVAQLVGTITGFDPVSGSWKPVYYRAIAWGTDDPTRGQYGVRSAPSVVRQVIVPPAEPPDLASPTIVLPTAGSANARIDFGTTAPISDTVLGPHLLEAEVLAVDAAGGTIQMPLLPSSGALSTLATSAPASGVSGLWRDATTAGSSPLHLLVRRTDASLSLRVRLRITDPLGRITEKVIDVPPGSSGLVPDIRHPVLTKTALGWALTFSTSTPNTVGGEAASLKVAFTPAQREAANLKVALPAAKRIVVRPSVVDLPLGSLPLLPRPPLSPFSDPKKLVTVYASKRTAGLRDVAVCVREPGTLVVTLRAPGGETASITRKLL